MSEAIQPFGSTAELVQAIQHPYYSHPIYGQSYQNYVAARLAVTDQNLLPEFSTKDQTGPHQERVEFQAGDAEKAQEIGGLERAIAELKAADDAEQQRALDAVRISAEPVVEGKQPKPFEYQSDMIAAISDPRYSRDQQYRTAVEARVAVSEGLGVSVRDGTSAQRETTSGQ